MDNFENEKKNLNVIRTLIEICKKQDNNTEPNSSSATIKCITIIQQCSLNDM